MAPSNEVKLANRRLKLPYHFSVERKCRKRSAFRPSEKKSVGNLLQEFSIVLNQQNGFPLIPKLFQ